MNPARVSTSVLVLAGSSEAAALARQLHERPGFDVVASFAGRVERLKPLPCPVRVGGFGGPEGLAGELRRGSHDLLVDATHPFAARMSSNAAAGAAIAGIPRLRLLRPPWEPGPGDDWHDVADLDEAAHRLRALGSRVTLLATGRQEVGPFACLPGTRFVLRTVEPPGPLPLDDIVVVLDRGPFAVESELALLRAHGVDAVVTRNSGATATAAKLVAARQLGIPVVMVRRPPPPPGDVLGTVDEAMQWIDSRRR